MTDTEILDHLQLAIDRNKSSVPSDFQVGDIVFTLPVRKVDFRALITEAIQRCVSARVARELRG